MSSPCMQDVELIRGIEVVPSVLDVVARITRMGFVTVARVTDERWVACEVLDRIDFGLRPGGELRVETTLCNEVRSARAAIVIDNVPEDAVYSDHPTPAMYGLQSYIAMPIILSDDSVFGTLCAIDPKPARVNTPEIVGMFKLFADLIATHIDARRETLASLAELAHSKEALAVTQGALLDARAAAELQDQFVAVLGHDLRNPLGAFASGVRLLLRKTQDEQSEKILAMMAASTRRMADLVGNLMDFARGRLGGGFALALESKPLGPTLQNVVDEIRAALPGCVIETSFDLPRPVAADHARLAQLLSNLLGNAATHGAPDRPIRVEARLGEGELILSVANAGPPIPPEARARLFQPFARGSAKTNRDGLGLGLFIASEIARAHGGTIDVASDEAETRFTLRMPA